MSTDPNPVRSTARRVALFGVPGRMGTRLVQLIAENPAWNLAAAIGRVDHPQMGQDVGILAGCDRLGIHLTSWNPGTDLGEVAIDFSVPSAALTHARACAEARIPLVIGTTGLTDDQKDGLAELAQTIPVLIAPNTNRVVAGFVRLIGEAAEILGDQAEIEIIERHHRGKLDSPSGTAIRLAERISGQTGIARNDWIYGREGRTGPRPSDQIGIHAIRGGDNPGEHTVIFAMTGDTVELTHKASNRDGFAQGALDLADQLVGRPPKLYSVDEF